MSLTKMLNKHKSLKFLNLKLGKLKAKLFKKKTKKVDQSKKSKNKLKTYLMI